MRFDLPAKSASLLFFLLVPFALPWLGNLALVVLLVVLRSAVPGLKPYSSTAARRFRKAVFYLAVAACVMILANSFLLRKGEALPLVGGLTLFADGLQFGLAVGCRFVALGTALLLFFSSTPVPAIADALHDAGMPFQIVVTLLLTLHFLDQLPARIDQIFTAQEARGAPVRSHFVARLRSFFSILSPLVLSSIVESIDRGMALELRGFGNAEPARESERSDRHMSFLFVTFLLLSLFTLLWMLTRWFLP